MPDRLPDLDLERQADGIIHAICQECHRYQEFANFTDALMWPHECPNE